MAQTLMRKFSNISRVFCSGHRFFRERESGDLQYSVTVTADRQTREEVIIKDGKTNILRLVPKDIFKSPFLSQADPQWGQEVQLPRVQQVI